MTGLDISPPAVSAARSLAEQTGADPYFEHAAPNVFDVGGTYVATEAVFEHMALGDDGEWRLAADPGRLPCSYTLQAVKEAAS